MQAKKPWNGKTTLSSDSDEVDQFLGFYNASSWGFARRSTQKLAGFTATMIAKNTKDHGDTCPAKPDVREQITIGGDPGIMLGYNCGLLINLAVAVHHGVGYQFGFRDPTLKAATDPADRAAFLAILESTQYPD